MAQATTAPNVVGGRDDSARKDWAKNNEKCHLFFIGESRNHAGSVSPHHPAHSRSHYVHSTLLDCRYAFVLRYLSITSQRAQSAQSLDGQSNGSECAFRSCDVNWRMASVLLLMIVL